MTTSASRRRDRPSLVVGRFRRTPCFVACCFLACFALATGEGETANQHQQPVAAAASQPAWALLAAAARWPEPVGDAPPSLGACLRNVTRDPERIGELLSHWLRDVRRGLAAGAPPESVASEASLRSFLAAAAARHPRQAVLERGLDSLLWSYQFVLVILVIWLLNSRGDAPRRPTPPSPSPAAVRPGTAGLDLRLESLDDPGLEIQGLEGQGLESLVLGGMARGEALEGSVYGERRAGGDSAEKRDGRGEGGRSPARGHRRRKKAE